MGDRQVMKQIHHHHHHHGFDPGSSYEALTSPRSTLFAKAPDPWNFSKVGRNDMYDDVIDRSRDDRYHEPIIEVFAERGI